MTLKSIFISQQHLFDSLDWFENDFAEAMRHPILTDLEDLLDNALLRVCEKLKEAYEL